jgi:hypothetical protein
LILVIIPELDKNTHPYQLQKYDLPDRKKMKTGSPEDMLIRPK